MSRASQPKQLIPFINGRSLLQIAVDRLEGLAPAAQQFICAGRDHREPILRALHTFDQSRYLAEPIGRDTVNAVGLGAAVIGRSDPDAVIAVFTADHIIEPVDRFQQIVTAGFELAQSHGNLLLTFGIAPTHAATGYGYLQLGQPLSEGADARVVEQFKEKPEAEAAQRYFEAGADQYLWNSGMFVWRASTLLACLERFAPENHAGLMEIAAAWDTDERDAVLDRVYPTLPKTSVDYAVMEPASQADGFVVAALPMPLTWLDVGSWPSYAKTIAPDEDGNAVAARHINVDTQGTLVASNDPEHLIATIGCRDLVIIHTSEATLVCPREDAERIKALHGKIADQIGDELL